MRAYLIASLIAYLNGRNHAGVWVVIAEIIFFYTAGITWVAVCLMGSLSAQMLRSEKIKQITNKTYVKWLFCIIVFVLIKRPEGNATYMIDGLCTLLMILVAESSFRMRKILGSVRITTFLGKYTMPIFMIHYAVFMLLGSKLYEAEGLKGMMYGIRAAIIFMICMFITVVVSLPLQRLLDIWNKGCSAAFERLVNWKEDDADYPQK